MEPNLLIRVFIFLTLIATSHASAGQWDYNASLSARSFPISAAPSFEIGYDEPIWGEPEPCEYFYGFVRPVITITPVLLVNQVQAMFEVYPVSFFKLGVGYYGSERFETITGLNCQTLQCQGFISGPVGAATLLLGAYGFFAAADVSEMRLTTPSGRPFGDENTYLSGNGPTDNLFSARMAAGYSLSTEWKAGFLYYMDRMTGSGSHDQDAALFARWSSSTDPWRITSGIGIYHSSTRGTEPQIFASLVWTGVPSLIAR